MLAGSNSNGGARHVQKICQEFNAGLVGLSLDGRRGQRDLENISELTSDGILPGAWVDLDGEGDSGSIFMDWNHAEPQAVSI